MNILDKMRRVGEIELEVSPFGIIFIRSGITGTEFVLRRTVDNKIYFIESLRYSGPNGYRFHGLSTNHGLSTSNSSEDSGRKINNTYTGQVFEK